MTSRARPSGMRPRGLPLRAAGDARRVRLCDTAVVVIRLHLDPDPDSAAALGAVDEALAGFLDDGDDEGILTAGLARLELLNELATWGPMVELTDQLRPLARRREDPLALAALTQYRGAALFFGPAPFAEALDWQTSGAEVRTRVGEIGRTFSLAATLAHLDRAEEARAALARGESLLADTVGGLALAWAAFGGAHAAVQLEDLPAAEELLRPGIEALQEIGERGWLSSLVPMLGKVRLERGDPAEARTLAELGRELSNPHDADSQASWRALLARLAAADGHVDEGSRLADEAVRWAETTDQTDTIAEVRCARAEVHARAGRLAEGRADLHVALSAYERKGSISGARRVRRLLDASPLSDPR